MMIPTYLESQIVNLERSLVIPDHHDITSDKLRELIEQLSDNFFGNLSLLNEEFDLNISKSKINVDRFRQIIVGKVVELITSVALFMLLYGHKDSLPKLIYGIATTIVSVATLLFAALTFYQANHYQRAVALNAEQQEIRQTYLNRLNKIIFKLNFLPSKVLDSKQISFDGDYEAVLKICHRFKQRVSELKNAINGPSSNGYEDIVVCHGLVYG